MPTTKLRIYANVARLLADARLDLVTEDTELRYAIDEAYAESITFVLRQANWRFAMVREKLTASGAVIPGYSHGFGYPTNYLKTHRIFTQTADTTRERPIDFRDTPINVATNHADVWMDFVSFAYADPETFTWPEHFTQAVEAHLAFSVAERVTGERGAAGRMSQLFSQLLEAAVQIDALPDDRWLPFQRNGDFLRAKHFVLNQGFWSYRDPGGVMRGLKEVQYVAEVDQATAGDPAHGFPYRFRLPDDHLRTHALFVPWDGYEAPINIREDAQDWSTDAPTFVARYLSEEVLDEKTWPDQILDAIEAYYLWKATPINEAGPRAESYAVQLAAAKAAYHREPNEWLKFQLNGTFKPALIKLLETGRWRFAVKTVSLTDSADPLPAWESLGEPASSYAYRHIQPNDLMRTIRIYYEVGAEPYIERRDIDFFEEANAFHTNVTPVTVRYVSRLGLDATKWSMAFRNALLALLQYEDARNNPEMTQLAMAKLQMFKDAERDAERLDDARDRPRVIRPAAFTRSRFGYRVLDRNDFIPTEIGPTPTV